MSATTTTKWLVLVYGEYGVVENDGYRVLPKVLEITAETPADVWEKLRLGDLTGGDSLDEIRLDSLKPSMDQSGPASRPGRVVDTSRDARVRVFRADEVLFPFLDEYLTARTAREAEERKKAEEASQLAAMQAIAARLGYQCVKA